MSRHRNVRNLDLDDELDDDYEEDEYYEEDDYNEDDYTYVREKAKTVHSYLAPEEPAAAVKTQRAAVNLVDEILDVVGPDFTRAQIGDALKSAGNDVQRATNLVLDQGFRVAPPPGLTPPPGLGGNKAKGVPSPPSGKMMTIVQAEDDGLEFNTVYPVTIVVPERPPRMSQSPIGTRKPATSATTHDESSPSPSRALRKRSQDGRMTVVKVRNSDTALRPPSPAKPEKAPVPLDTPTTINSLPPATSGNSPAGVGEGGASSPPTLPSSVSGGLEPLKHAIPAAGGVGNAFERSATLSPSPLGAAPLSSLSSISEPAFNLSGNGVDGTLSSGPSMTGLGGSVLNLSTRSSIAGLSNGLAGLSLNASGASQGIAGQSSGLSGLSSSGLGTASAVPGLSSTLSGLSSSALGPSSGIAGRSADLAGLSAGSLSTASTRFSSGLAGLFSGQSIGGLGSTGSGGLSLGSPSLSLGTGAQLSGLAGLSSSLEGQPLGISGTPSGLAGLSVAGIQTSLNSQSTGNGKSGIAWPSGNLSLAELSNSSMLPAALGQSGGLNVPNSQSSGLMSGSDAIKSALAALGNSSQSKISLGSPAPASSGMLGGSLGHLGNHGKSHFFPTHTPARTARSNAPSAFPDTQSSSSQTGCPSQPFSLFPDVPPQSESLPPPLVAPPSAFAEFFACAPQSPKPTTTNIPILPSHGSLAAADENMKPFKFDSPSPDDVVGLARQQVSQAKSHSTKTILKPAVKVQPLAKTKAADRPSEPMDQMQQDMSALGFSLSKTTTAALSPNIARTVSAPGVKSSLPAPPAMAKTASATSVGKGSPKMKRINVADEYKKRNTEKETLNLVVVGHVDAGKSTLMGHLLYLLGEVSDRSMKKFERDAEKMKKGSFAYAWVLDETDEERSRGVTIDVAITKFETPHRKFTLLDAPGHRDFVPNMMSGASQADVAILVVGATVGEFETGFDSGGQTREHAVLIRSLGVNQLIVAVNKLDVVDWSKARFDEISEKLATFLAQVGFKKSKLWFVPTSGFTGENLIKRSSEKLSAWYSGPTLVSQIDAFDPPTRPIDKPFRLSISDYFKGGIAAGGGGGAVSVSGRIEGGSVQVGESVLVLPINETGVVKALEVAEESVKWAVAGDNVLMSLSGVDITHINIGSILCDPSSPIPITTHFVAQIVTFDIDIPLTIGVPVVLHHQSLTEQATITRLQALLNRTTNEVVKKNPRALPRNVTALVEIKTARPVCIDLFRNSKELGRFLLRSGMVTVAGGVVMNILSYEKAGLANETAA